MTDTTTDAQLVAAHLSGDRGAFAAIYDRYGDTLYDMAAAMTRDRHDAADITQDVFVVAAERMEQLRDPTRLKPWLFAILRNEVYRRTGKRKRTVVTDFTEPVAEMHLPTHEPDEASDIEFQELAELVRGAAAGLDERDQMVLEYTVRQGLEGDDLADALGVTPQQSYNLVHRMRQRTERSLGAYCVARKGRKDCDELAKILTGWDGEFSVLIRKRVARHVDGCDICERSRRKLAPLALFGAAPAFAAPTDLRERVLAAAGGGNANPAYAFTAPGGFPVAKTAARLAFWMVLATIALLIVGGTSVFVLARGDDGSVATTDSTTTTQPGDTTTTAVAAAPATIGGASTTTTTEATTSTTAASSDTAATTVPPTSTTTTSNAVLPPVVTVPPASTVVTPATTTTTPATTTTTTPTTTTTTPPTTTTTTSTTTTTTLPPAPGQLSLSVGTIDFGTTVDQVAITLSNTGGQPVDWSSLTGPSGFRGGATPYFALPVSGTLAPGASVSVTVGVNRTWPKEGPLAPSRVTFFADGTSAVANLTGEIARPPELRVRFPGATHCPFDPNFGVRSIFPEAAASDESPPITVVWRVTHAEGAVSVAMDEDIGIWYGSFNLDFNGDGAPELGMYTWTMVATDAFGNRTEVDGQTDVQTRYC